MVAEEGFTTQMEPVVPVEAEEAAAAAMGRSLDQVLDLLVGGLLKQEPEEAAAAALAVEMMDPIQKAAREVQLALGVLATEAMAVQTSQHPQQEMTEPPATALGEGAGAVEEA